MSWGHQGASAHKKCLPLLALPLPWASPYMPSLCPGLLKSEIWSNSLTSTLLSLFLRVTTLPSFTGMVEMIPNAETLRKIQVEHGVTGSFKDRPLADWLQKHNHGEEEYEKVEEGVSAGVVMPATATSPGARHS